MGPRAIAGPGAVVILKPWTAALTAPCSRGARLSTATHRPDCWSEISVGKERERGEGWRDVSDHATRRVSPTGRSRCLAAEPTLHSRRAEIYGARFDGARLDRARLDG